ncbi:hypothetical protein AtEden1_Chr5g0132191 [Arabidopsis thaliana]
MVGDGDDGMIFVEIVEDAMMMTVARSILQISQHIIVFHSIHFVQRRNNPVT